MTLSSLLIVQQSVSFLMPMSSNDGARCSLVSGPLVHSTLRGAQHCLCVCQPTVWSGIL